MANTTTGPDNVVNIKVIGVGGGGNNAVNRMVLTGVTGVEFIAINTDRPVLSNSSADIKVPIGEKLTKGQGAGADPEVGRKAAEESRNDIAKALEGADAVFITCGMGGGTGTGAAPIVAEIAREAGALTIAVVTKPFGYEGKIRMNRAEEGISKLLDVVDSLFVIPNDRLKLVSDAKITMKNAYKIADDELEKSIKSIVEIVSCTAFVNIDFADATSVLKNAGLTHVGIGLGTGKNMAEDAIRQAVTSTLMDTSIEGASALLVNITTSSDVGLDDIEGALNIVREMASPDAEIFIGNAFDDDMEDQLNVAIIATKFAGVPVRAREMPKPVAPRAEAPKPAPVAPSPAAPAPAPKPVEPNYAQGPAATAAPEPAPRADRDEEDPFDMIADIFNGKGSR